MLCRKLIVSLAKRNEVTARIRAIHVAQTNVKYVQNTNNKSFSGECSVLSDCPRSNLKILKRFNYNKGRQSKKQEHEETNDELEDIPQDKNNRVVTAKVNSLRLDAIVKAGLNIARNKVEVAFYGSKIRVNGKKMFKKSIQLHVGDEVDLVRGPSPTNPDFLLVSRIEILSANGDDDGIRVKLRRNKSLLIENYEDAWKPVAE